VSEYRQDPLTERWVVLAPKRALRPHALPTTPPTPVGSDTEICPFCPGNESLCPECLWEYADLPTKNWSLRVVRNLYPAVAPLDIPPVNSPVPVPHDEPLFHHQPALGSHEVVIESSRHITRSYLLTTTELRHSFDAFHHRFQAWRQAKPLKWGIAFKNDGQRAGASLEHVHSQLLATTMLPSRFAEEWEGARRWFAREKQCIFCQILNRESSLQHRIVEQTEHFVVLCPYASRTPFETWIVPRDHSSDFDQASTPLRHQAADTLHHLLQRIQRVLPDTHLNYLIHTSPFDTIDNDHYHWHIEIIPRLAQLAGYEWGTDQHINVVSPEQAAQMLQDA
jgi:UDPglucose--hexose-1-phosphate uridylyltransferase